MLKRNKGILIATTLVMLVPMIVGLLLWNQLPDQVPIHWNAAGEVDGWGSRAMVVFALPLFVLTIHWVCFLITCADPKHKDVHGKVVHMVLWICPILSLVCHTFVYASALGYDLSIEIIMPLLFGVLFMIIGNLMPKCKRNYTIGIRLPWTLNDEENWNKTHRLTGKVWVAGGALIAATSIFGSFVVFIIVTLVMAFIPVIYSYLDYRKNK
jgi:uncharacterized membrane protein